MRKRIRDSIRETGDYKMALDAVTKIINRTSPDLIVFTGDTIFQFLLKAGTMNN